MISNVKFVCVCDSMNTSVSDSPFCCCAADGQAAVNSVSSWYFHIDIKSNCIIIIILIIKS